MSPEVKRKWVEALRSGEYVQGKGYLKREVDGAVQHCCLGVLCELAKQNGVVMQEERHPGILGGVVLFDSDSGMPPDSVLEWAGESETEDPAEVDYWIEVLVARNDRGEPFSEIADWIEENL